MRNYIASGNLVFRAGAGDYAGDQRDAIDQSVVNTYGAALESVAQRDGVIWLYTPEGVATSKLAGKWTRAVKGDVTGCDLRAIKTLVEMLDG